MSEFTGCVCVCAYGGKPKSGLHKAECVCVCVCVCVCGRSAARVSIHVAAANGMTTSLLPITICLLCANLSQHIQVWPCPHLTLSRSMTRGRTEGREKGKKENIRALTKTVALEGGNGERGQQRAKTRHIHGGGGILLTPLAQEQTTYLQHPGFKSAPGLFVTCLLWLPKFLNGFLCTTKNLKTKKNK